MNKAITYVGNGPGITVRVNRKFIEFEWQKSQGIGSRSDEVDLDSALKLAKRTNKNGKKLFKIE